jgi:uncharacterized RDD family membrane protein YckC
LSGGYAPSRFGTYASWWERVVVTLWDFLYLWPGWVTGLVGYVMIIAAAVGADSGDSANGALLGVAILLVIVGFVLVIWRTVINYFLDQGRTGYTYGRRKVGVRLIREIEGTPTGAWSCVARYFLNGLINQACYIDYLWPLWDPKRQTLTDKILTTIVVHQPPPR